MVKKVVVAIDSYKGCATSAELNTAVKQGIAQYNPHISVTCQAIADGGEGSMQAIYEFTLLKNSIRRTSKSPISVSRTSGITGSAMKERVMKGSLSV